MRSPATTSAVPFVGDTMPVSTRRLANVGDATVKSLAASVVPVRSVPASPCAGSPRVCQLTSATLSTVELASMVSLSVPLTVTTITSPASRSK